MVRRCHERSGSPAKLRRSRSTRRCGLRQVASDLGRRVLAPSLRGPKGGPGAGQLRQPPTWMSSQRPKRSSSGSDSMPSRGNVAEASRSSKKNFSTASSPRRPDCSQLASALSPGRLPGEGGGLLLSQQLGHMIPSRVANAPLDLEDPMHPSLRERKRPHRGDERLPRLRQRPSLRTNSSPARSQSSPARWQVTWETP